MCYLHLEILYFHSYQVTDCDNVSQNHLQNSHKGRVKKNKIPNPQLSILTNFSLLALLTM